jgi:L-serine dehydratase
MYESIEALIRDAKQKNKVLHEVILDDEMEILEKGRDEILSRLSASLVVMRQSLQRATTTEIKLPIKEAMGQAERVLKTPPFFLHPRMKEAVGLAMAIAEYSSGMGLICAAPTAGSSGILPATLFQAQLILNKTEEELLHALVVAAEIGGICGNRASLSGSEAGCQAEVGVASAMAAAGITYMAGGTLEQVGHAVALAIKNLLGLVCDPVAGLVISPCIKRNAIGTMNAFLSAELALSGVTSIISPDEIIDSMIRVGHDLPPSVKETGIGGIAGSPRAQMIKNELFSDLTKSEHN